MKGKIFTKLLMLTVLGLFLLVPSCFAATVLETTDEYKDNGAFIYGSTRFDPTTIMTPDLVFNAGINESKVWVALGNKLNDLKPVTPYYYDGASWFKVASTKVTPITDEATIEKIEDNLHIFFVGEEMKTVEVPYDGIVDEGSETEGAVYDKENKQFLVPALSFDFEFTSGGVETKVNTNIDTNIKAEEGEEPEKVEIKRNPEVTFELAKEIVAGEATEFTVSTKANDYEGVMVVGTGSVNPDNVLKLEYAVGEQWVDMTGESLFGNEGAGFPLQDATSKFRVTFDKPGEYDVTFAIKNLETKKIMAEVATKTNVTTIKNVSSAEELQKAMANNYVTDIKLTDNIDLPTAVKVTKKVRVDLNNCALTLKEDTEGYGAFYVLEGGDLTINGEGTVNGVGNNDYNVAIFAENGKVTINGGTYTNIGATGKDADHFDLIYSKGEKGIVEINGGYFEGQTPAWLLNLKDKSGATIVVKGGTFVGFNPADNACENPKVSFLAEGYKVTVSNNEYKVVELGKDDVAIANGIAYTDLQTAVDKVEAGTTITLLQSVDLPTAVKVTKKVTIDLNSKDLTLTKDEEGYGVFYVLEGGDLTINGEGTVNGVGNNDYNVAIFAENGKVTINGGTYTNIGATGKDADHFDLIYSKGEKGIVEINGGYFEGQTPAWLLNLKDKSGATIAVKGGTFVGFNPADNACENPKVSFVAEGYKVVANGDNYTVVAE